MLQKVWLLRRRLEKAIGERGLLGTGTLAFKFATSTVRNRLHPERRKAEKYARNFDKRYGVDTGGDMSPLEMGDPPLKGDAGYNGVNFHEFLELFTRLEQVEHFDHAKATFVDIGSGKGRALLLASDWPFLAIRGVEYWPALNDVARANIVKYRGEKQRCFDIVASVGDARTYEFPETPLLLFLFSPFDAATLEEVLGHVFASVEKTPREVAIVGILEPEIARLIDARAELIRTYKNGWQGIWRTKPR